MKKKIFALLLVLSLLLGMTTALAQEGRGLLRGSDATPVEAPGGEGDPSEAVTLEGDSGSVAIEQLGLRLSVPEGWQIVKTYDTPSLIDYDLISDSAASASFAFTATKADAYAEEQLATLSDEERHSLLWLAGIYNADSYVIEQGLLGRVTLDVLDLDTKARHLVILWQGWLLDVSAMPQGSDGISRQDRLLQLTLLSELGEEDLPIATPEPEPIADPEPTEEPAPIAGDGDVYQIGSRTLTIYTPPGYLMTDFSTDEIFIFTLLSMEADPVYLFMEMVVPGLSVGDDFSLLSQADIDDVVESVAADFVNPQITTLDAQESPYGLMTLILTAGDGTYSQWMFIEDGHLYSGAVQNLSGVTDADLETLGNAFILGY